MFFISVHIHTWQISCTYGLLVVAMCETVGTPVGRGELACHKDL